LTNRITKRAILYWAVLLPRSLRKQLQPWVENLKKRQVRAPKIYLRDTGLLHSLLNISNKHELLGHPRLGASWEGFALEQVLNVLRPAEAYFWATYSGAELDLIFFAGGKRFGIEFKFNEAPSVGKSMHSALNDLNLHHLWVVFPGGQSYPAHEKITMLAMAEISTLPDRLAQIVAG